MKKYDFSYEQLFEKVIELHKSRHNITEDTYITIDEPLPLFREALVTLRRERKQYIRRMWKGTKTWLQKLSQK